MKTISLNESFELQFICKVSEYEDDVIILRRLGFKPKYEDVTRENSPLTFAEGRNEVLFTVPVKNVTEAAFIREALKRANRG